MFISKSKFVAVAGLCLLLIACSTSQIVLALNGASIAVTVASTTVANTQGIDAATKSQITTYLNATAAGLSMAATDLNSGTLTAQQIAQIQAALVAAVVPSLSPSTPPVVVAAITAVSAGVSAFLNLLQQPQAIRLMKVNNTITLHLSYSDHRVLNDIRSRMAAVPR